MDEPAITVGNADSEYIGRGPEGTDGPPIVDYSKALDINSLNLTLPFAANGKQDSRDPKIFPSISTAADNRCKLRKQILDLLNQDPETEASLLSTLRIQYHTRATFISEDMSGHQCRITVRRGRPYQFSNMTLESESEGRVGGSDNRQYFAKLVCFATVRFSTSNGDSVQRTFAVTNPLNVSEKKDRVLKARVFISSPDDLFVFRIEHITHRQV